MNIIYIYVNYYISFNYQLKQKQVAITTQTTEGLTGLPSQHKENLFVKKEKKIRIASFPFFCLD